MNILPGLTTDAAWFRRPIRERRTCFLPERQGDKLGCPASTSPKELPSFVVYSLGDVVRMTVSI